MRSAAGGNAASATFPERAFLWNDVCAEASASVLEVRVSEEGSVLGMGEALLGRVEVPLERLKGNKSKQAEWHELKKGSKSTGVDKYQSLLQLDPNLVAYKKSYPK